MILRVLNLRWSHGRRAKLFAGVVVAIVLGITGGLKLAAPYEFQQNILSYGLFTGWQAKALAHYIPIVEVLAALALLIPRYRFAGLGTAALLLTAFLVISGYAWVAKPGLACGCFGLYSGTSSTAFIVDVVLLVLVWIAKPRATGALPQI